MDMYSALRSFNMLITVGLVETKQDCLKKLFETVRTTRRVSRVVR